VAQEPQSEFCVNDAVFGALRLMEPILSDCQIEIDTKKVNTCNAIGYKNELEHVVVILLSNSKDAIQESKPANARISISIRAIGEHDVEIVVDDNGGGFDEAVRDRIFEPYFTTKEQGKGVGVGLYMAKELVERQMGGKITAENIESGARFRVAIPVS